MWFNWTIWQWIEVEHSSNSMKTSLVQLLIGIKPGPFAVQQLLQIEDAPARTGCNARLKTSNEFRKFTN